MLHIHHCVPCHGDWERAVRNCKEPQKALCPSCERLVRVFRFIDATQGRFFSVLFTKRTDGKQRRMIARTGVRKHVTGEGLAFDPLKRGLIPVWSADAQGYRMIPCENVISITFQGREVTF